MFLRVCCVLLAISLVNLYSVITFVPSADTAEQQLLSYIQNDPSSEDITAYVAQLNFSESEVQGIKRGVQQTNVTYFFENEDYMRILEAYTAVILSREPNDTHFLYCQSLIWLVKNDVLAPTSVTGESLSPLTYLEILETFQSLPTSAQLTVQQALPFHLTRVIGEAGRQMMSTNEGRLRFQGDVAVQQVWQDSVMLESTFP